MYRGSSKHISRRPRQLEDVMTGAAEGSLLIALYSTFSMGFHVQLLDDLTTFIIITDIPSELQVRRTLGTGIVHAQKDSNDLRLPFIKYLLQTLTALFFIFWYLFTRTQMRLPCVCLRPVRGAHVLEAIDNTLCYCRTNVRG
jgi:hypothetical protein